MHSQTCANGAVAPISDLMSSPAERVPEKLWVNEEVRPSRLSKFGRFTAKKHTVPERQVLTRE